VILRSLHEGVAIALDAIRFDSNEFLINGGSRAQTNPQVGYASSHGVFMVSAEDWRKKKAWQPGWEYLLE